MSVRFVHTSDWQIGKVFADLSELDRDRASLLKTQRIQTVERIAHLARERHADCVIVAGDVFDAQDVPDELLRRTMNALTPFPGPWLLLPGNHDAAIPESVFTRLAQLGVPSQVKLLLSPEPCLVADRIAVLPAPLRRRHETRDVSDALDAMETPSGLFRIGVAHGSIKSRLPDRSEAKNDIAADRSARARLDYFALGDWHGFHPIDSRTFYSGTPEPDRFKEAAQAKQSPSGNVLWVEIEEPGATPSVELVRTGHYLWEKRALELHLPDDVEQVDAVFSKLSSPQNTLLDLTLTGALPLSAREALSVALESWRARLHLLRVSDEHLLSQVTDEDLADLPPGSWVSAVAEELRQELSQPGEAGLSARLAVRMLLHDIRTEAGHAHPKS